MDLAPLEGQWEILDSLALRGSAGFTVLGLHDSSDPNNEVRGAYGGGYTLGLSYDLFVHRSKVSGGLSLQPVFAVGYLPDDPISVVTMSLGLELMWWSGLPNNQLEFAPGEGYDKKEPLMAPGGQALARERREDSRTATP